MSITAPLVLWLAATQAPQEDKEIASFARAYHARVKELARAEEGDARRDSGILLDTRGIATGRVVDRRGNPVEGAAVEITHFTEEGPLGWAETDREGKFAAALRARKAGGWNLVVKAPGFVRWARGKLDGGVVDREVMLEREVNAELIESLAEEKDAEARLWLLFEIIGPRRNRAQDEMETLYKDIGRIRTDLLRVVRSGLFKKRDERDFSPHSRALRLLAYWGEPEDEPLLKEWLAKEKWARPAKVAIEGATVEEACERCREAVFAGIPEERRTSNLFSKPILGFDGRRALVRYSVTYAHWGYEEHLVFAQREGKWCLRYAVEILRACKNIREE